eukprot:1322013-Amorphochlora_amoeboformis.AAC.2
MQPQLVSFVPSGLRGLGVGGVDGMSHTKALKRCCRTYCSPSLFILDRDGVINVDRGTWY